MAAITSAQKLLKTLGMAAGLLVILSTLIGGVIETRVRVGLINDDLDCLEVKTEEHVRTSEAKLQVHERRTQELERHSEKQAAVLDQIRDTLGDLRTEQRVQGQYLKSFVEEYRREKETR